MKKIVSILMILCMFLAAASVLAEGNEVPTLESMPNVKAYEGLEEPDIALFNGTWEPTENIFTDGVYVELEQIMTAFNPPKIMIYDGKEAAVAGKWSGKPMGDPETGNFFVQWGEAYAYG